MSTFSHVDEEVLEKYAMNALGEAEAEAVEDHIALCAQCLTRLEDVTSFVGGMRAALQAPPAVVEISPRWFQKLPVSVSWWAAAAIAAGFILFFAVRPTALPPMATVVLDATRGMSKVVKGTGPFDFELQVPDAGKSYHVELLDGAGAKKWESDLAAQGGKLHAKVNQRLDEGQYFLRLTDPASGQVRDFGVNLQK